MTGQDSQTLTEKRSMSTTTGQVLEFALGEETYCVSIDYVTEIVDINELTAVPNSPPHVKGVMNLRGKTTSIVDPAVVFDIDEETDPNRIIVFDSDLTENDVAVGWLVDRVEQVVRVDTETVDRSPAQDEKAIRGVIKQEDGSFVIWVDPGTVHS